MEDHLDIWVKISTQIGELNGFIKTALDKISDHEKRIDYLEKERPKKVELKDNIIQWLVRGIVASIFVIGTISGSGTILAKVFAPSQVLKVQQGK